MTTVTVDTGVERRRRWSIAEKVRIVEESLAPGAICAAIARRHDVHPNLLHLWRRHARTGILSLMPEGGRRFVPVAVASGGAATVPARHGAGAGTAVIEVVLRNGRVLRVVESVAPARAASLADALEGLER